MTEMMILAKKISKKYARFVPGAEDDLFSDACLALVSAERSENRPQDADECLRFTATVVSRAVISGLRKEMRVRKHRVNFPTFDPAVNCHSEADQIEAWRASRIEIAESLPAKQRQVFLAMYGDRDYSDFSTAAEKLGIDVATVRETHRRMVTSLRCKFQHDGARSQDPAGDYSRTA
jgi:DNA-directed RNA polymerase specialized sigma24 family protein